MAKVMFDFINEMIEIEKKKKEELSYEEWCFIRRNGSPDEIAEAVERMMAQGGYDNLA